MIISLLPSYAMRKRENTQSSFGKEFCEYWKRRETSEAATKAHKRRLDTFLQLNEDTCEGIEAISKNVHRKKANNDSTGGKPSSDVDQNSLENEDSNEEVPDNNALNNNVPDNNEENNIETRNNDYDVTVNLFKEVINTTNKISVELSSFQILLFDDKGVAALLKDLLGEKLYCQIKTETSLLMYHMSPFCSDLISLVTEAPPSTALLRKIIRKSTLGDETFDPIIHADLSFVEVVATHL
ncbi:MAG: hypothetical protein EXX96DRAFT_598139 [Benjaminiella poitrasii]|nr:MAG: hypothetical protein EXX96DRAFT_598139 [Benjaminiella poitrasii]